MAGNKAIEVSVEGQNARDIAAQAGFVTKPVSPKYRDLGGTLSEKQRARALVKAFLEIAPVRNVIDLGKPFRPYRRLLNSCLPSRLKFRGVYSSFAEARASAPRGAQVGYDHEGVASVHEWQADVTLASDYPAMFWISKCLRNASRLFDFGGNVGVSFYAWQHYLSYRDDLRWLVCDLPAVTRRGRQLALARQESRISFTSRFDEIEGFDVLLTSGTLQNVETPIAQLLSAIRSLPQHIVINRTPLNASRAGVTLLNTGEVISPYNVFHRDNFITELESLGYKLIDAWSNDDHCCWIPFYPEYSVESYSGLYFQRERK